MLRLLPSFHTRRAYLEDLRYRGPETTHAGRRLRGLCETLPTNYEEKPPPTRRCTSNSATAEGAPGLGGSSQRAAAPRLSGKAHPSKGAQGVFFCYALPALDVTYEANEDEPDTAAWTEDAGCTQWYYYDLEREKIVPDAAEIVGLDPQYPETPRRRDLENETLSDIGRRSRNTSRTPISRAYRRLWESSRR